MNKDSNLAKKVRKDSIILMVLIAEAILLVLTTSFIEDNSLKVVMISVIAVAVIGTIIAMIWIAISNFIKGPEKDEKMLSKSRLIEENLDISLFRRVYLNEKSIKDSMEPMSNILFDVAKREKLTFFAKIEGEGISVIVKNANKETICFHIFKTYDDFLKNFRFKFENN